VRTTDSNHGLPVAPNLLSRDFVQKSCNRVWVSDYLYPDRRGLVVPCWNERFVHKKIV